MKTSNNSALCRQMSVEQAMILSNERIAKDIYRMVLQAPDIAKAAKPGQFVQVEVPHFFLRRPISISDCQSDRLVLVYKVVGSGTEALCRLKAGQKVSLFGPLGHGFPIKNQSRVLLAGGGVGIPPLLLTARKLLENHAAVDVVLGFTKADEIFYIDAFEQLGLTPVVCTMDGSVGIRGTVIQGIESLETCGKLMACGPVPMLKALAGQFDEGYVSMESRMACGIGVCQGCVVKSAQDTWLRVCKEGPVFEISEVKL